MGGLFSKSSLASSSERHSVKQATHAQRAPQLSKASQKFSYIADQYTSLEQVTEALRAAGLESSNLIVGIDFTKSNEWTGKRSFNGKSLHDISSDNPYQQAISIIGRTISAFDDDNLIPCFGFGDASTHDQAVFSFYPDHRPCIGFEEALARYKEIVPYLRLAGPTSFAPIIEAATSIVEQSEGQYHVLLIIADGQVTRSVDTEYGRLSPQEQRTIEAIVNASAYALSIVLVGVGDGPWDMMKQFDDNIPHRTFDNFQFVNFTQIMARNMAREQKEAAFALAALMEIPSQYKATIELNILNHPQGKVPKRNILPPPPGVMQHDNSMFGYPHSTSFSHPSSNIGYDSNQNYGGIPSPASQFRGETSSDSQACPVCLLEPKDMAFGCGHQTCRNCAEDLRLCPLCRQEITTRIRLY